MILSYCTSGNVNLSSSKCTFSFLPFSSCCSITSVWRPSYGQFCQWPGQVIYAAGSGEAGWCRCWWDQGGTNNSGLRLKARRQSFWRHCIYQQSSDIISLKKQKENSTWGSIITRHQSLERIFLLICFNWLLCSSIKKKTANFCNTGIHGCKNILIHCSETGKSGSPHL